MPRASTLPGEEMSGMVLLRRLIGDVLRRHRIRQGRTLRDVSAAAQVSLGYLSEVERGRKEASSELLAAICAALEVSLADVLREVSADLSLLEKRAVMPMRPVRTLAPTSIGAGSVRVAVPDVVAPTPDAAVMTAGLASQSFVSSFVVAA